jgi:hypothetical protein
LASVVGEAEAEAGEARRSELRGTRIRAKRSAGRRGDGKRDFPADFAGDDEGFAVPGDGDAVEI